MVTKWSSKGSQNRFENEHRNFNENDIKNEPFWSQKWSQNGATIEPTSIQDQTCTVLATKMVQNQANIDPSGPKSQKL
jgi:uncharacterized membrane protein